MRARDSIEVELTADELAAALLRLAPARGACVAALSYDLVRQFERLRPRASSLPSNETDPDAVLAFFDRLVVHDYARGTTRLVGVGRGAGRLEEARAALL